MKELFFVVVFVLFVNISCYATQQSIDEINPSAQYFSYSGTLLNSYDAGNRTLKEFSSDELPTSEGDVSTDTGIFTDMFKTLKNWFLQSTGLNYVIGIVSAVPNLLKAIGLSSEVAFLLGFFWHAFSIFLIISFMRS
jgi:hypothetical protein